MTKADLIKKVASDIGVNQSEANKIVSSFIKEMVISMDEGETIYLRGLGTFWKQVQERKMVTNIHTENMGIDTFKFAKIRFRTSDTLRNKLSK